MRYGTIIKYFPDKMFGFIRPDVGKDVFFHISALDAGETQPEINVGQAVKFELTPRAELVPKDRPESDREKAADRSRSEQPRAKVIVLIDKLPGGTLEEVGDGQPSSRHPRARKKKPTWRK
jgi:cold shock CspA family protein